MTLSASCTSLAPFCRPEWVLADLAASDGDAALAEIVGHLEAGGALGEREAALAALRDREALGCTAGLLGSEIANPHGRVPGLRSVVLAVARSRRGVAFGGGAAPVRLIFVLLAPEEARSEYLAALAGLARWIRKHQHGEAVLAAGGPDEIFALLTEPDA